MRQIQYLIVERRFQLELEYSMENSLDLQLVSLAPFNYSEDSVDFADMLMEHLPSYYDDVDPGFVQSILQTHQLGYDPVGHFTKRKVIYRVCYADRKIGYTVITEKLGGCIKIGPTIIYLRWRSQGIGTRLRYILGEMYKLKGFRKAYSTVADNKWESYRYLVKAGYAVEAHLKVHYSKGHGELVLGNFLEGRFKAIQKDAQINNRVDFEISTDTRKWRQEVGQYLFDSMKDSYTIDEKFISSLFAAEDRGQGDYSLKGKRIFVALNGHKIQGVAVTTAKRGGAIKAAPFIVEAQNVIPKLVDSITEHYTQISSRKIMTLVPEHCIYTDRVLMEYGFGCEGLLQEPYKRRRKYESLIIHHDQ